MASRVTASCIEMMNDLDEIKDVLPEGLYLNMSNLLKAEYQRQQGAPQTTFNGVTLNMMMGNLNVSVPESVPQQATQVPQQGPDEDDDDFWHVRDYSDGVWYHVLLGADGQYSQDLRGYYNTVESNLQTAIFGYIDTLDMEEAKYFVERYGVASAIKMHAQFNGATDYDDDESLYKGLLFHIIQEAFQIERGSE